MSGALAGGNRYSTIVAWVKVALPLIALGLLSTLFLFSRTPDPDAALPFAEVDVEQLAREQRLSRPRFAGTLEDGREVVLTADTAAPQTTNPNMILLTTVESRVALSENSELLVQAAEGDIDLAGQIVDLDGSVTATTTEGWRFASDHLTLAMDEMRVTSPGPIVVESDGIRIEAAAMEFTGPEDAAFLSFTGGVRLLYEPGD